MKCTVSFVSIVILIVVAGLLALVILWLIPESCPRTSFRCEEDNTCLDIRFLCDGTPHCSSVNASDEIPLRCKDLTGLKEDIEDILNLSKRNFSTTTTTASPTTAIPDEILTQQPCMIHYPDECDCRSGYLVNCSNTNWTTIDWNKFHPNTTRLFMQNVLIGDWEEEDANHTKFVNLKHLSLDDAQPKNLDTLVNLKVTLSTLNYADASQNLILENHDEMRTFPYKFLKNIGPLNSLYLENNNFEVLKDGSFVGQIKLGIIQLGNNSIRSIEPNAFSDLKSLRTLNLSNNKISLDPLYRFRGMPNLKFMNLSSNKIEEIGHHMFRNLDQLVELLLGANRIRSIHPRAFRYNILLRTLDISYNNIVQLAPETFTGLKDIQKLKIGANPLHFLSPELFSSQLSLVSLDLVDLDLENIDLGIFSLLRNLSFVYFKKFEYCQYIPHVPNCRPNTDGLSSFKNLLNGTLIRVVVWVIALITLFGNIMVIRSRWVSTKESKILDVFFKNLAAADFMMGVYLVIIAVADIAFRENYNSHAYAWYTSWACIGTGIMVMVSSEVSLLILTIMSLERYLVISGPFSYRKLNKKWAILSMLLIWIFVSALAVTPALMWKSSFYGGSGLCFTLHLHDPFSRGWEYNAFVFIALNSLCLTGIAVFYGRLFWVVRETSSATPRVAKDIEMAIRFFFIVLTDFLCWAPIILLKLAVLQGYRIPQQVLVWITILVLPLNSAINPILYTFSTGKIRVKIFGKLFSTHITESKTPIVVVGSQEAKLVALEGASEDSKLHSSINDGKQKYPGAVTPQRRQPSASREAPRQDSTASNGSASTMLTGSLITSNSKFISE